MTKKTKALTLSILAMILCVAMLAGTTFAWFTDTASSTGNRIQAGNLEVDLLMWDGTKYDSIANGTTGDIFKEATSATNSNATLWEPGKTQVVYLAVANNGNLSLQYNVLVDVTNGGLVGALEWAIIDNVAMIEDANNNSEIVEINNMSWTEVAQIAEIGDLNAGRTVAAPNGKLSPADQTTRNYDTIDYFALLVHMKEDAGNDYQGKHVNIDVVVTAAQLADEQDTFGSQYDENAEYYKPPVDEWDGTSNIDWFLEDPFATTFTLDSAEELAGLASLLDGTANLSSTTAYDLSNYDFSFAGKTIKLDGDVDLGVKDANGEPISFEPIGGCRDEAPFKGTFDGQGHTISNMSQNTWALNNGYYYSGELGIGLFGGVEDAYIKNLVVDGAAISGESALCGAVAGVAMGDCTFENITVKNAQVNDYQYGAGGIVGWASGKQTYKGIHVDETTVVGSQWGDFGNASGGIIGQASTRGTYHFEDCTVACRIDATNDIVSAYQWYCYRNSGMLIGKVDDYVQNEVKNVVAENVTCKNVTVIYNDWANYTYCEFAGTSYPYVRVQAGVSVEGYSNVRYGHPTDANGNKVVDDNHVHNDGEDHHLLLVFDQLFGGPANARYCYYGIAEHPGVTVKYNNK